MRITIIGGGPAGLYFSILMKAADPRHEITIFERNRPDDTFGFGVVFSAATLGNLEDADAETHAAITQSFVMWDDIDVHFRDRVLTSTGHGFAGLSRRRLLALLASRAEGLGVRLEYEHDLADLDRARDADLVIGADGVNSGVRRRFEASFAPTIGAGKSRFVWLGSSFPFRAFTFLFQENAHGLFRVHAYRYAPEHSTFILECSEETLRKTGLAEGDEDATLNYAEVLFREQLAGHRLVKNRSVWRSFPTVRCARWRHENVVLLGDAAHTAHFSIGSGTKLALEDAIALARQLRGGGDVARAADAYEAERRPVLDATQRAAEVSQAWFEETERYVGLAPLTFTMSLLTRSLRVTHENLKVRDPAFVKTVDADFAERASAQSGVEVALDPPPPPMFTPFRVGQLVLPNRVVVAPMCTYSAEDGTIDDFHLVHLGSRAVGGAGLVLTEMTDVSRDGRISPGCAGLYAEEHVTAWKRVVDFVHAHSEAKIGVQLAHAGRKGSTRRAFDGIDQPLEEGGWEIVAPSPLPFLPGTKAPRELTEADLDALTREFVRSTEMAAEAGFDLLEVHAAHGYLLSTFLSPLTNRRTDAFGGSLENRLRFPVRIVEAVRATWPRERPISVRISATDWHPGGMTPGDSVVVARAFAAAGADIIHVSAGGVVADAKPVHGRLFQVPFAERIRLEASVPTIAVGAIASYADVNSILAAGRADLCSLARAHLYDPYWTRHAARDQGFDLPWPKPYGRAATYAPR